ncbi:kinetochore-associated Ndc80 complex subunit NDC80 [Sporobolomyces salmoneus]|uniref:kinetochore-associated Ndc80 complex subunit NDC80 n=1 Tax=Sporobolomyces salmoneus TaxID=183962 RepID=UPI00317FDD7A
MGDRRRTIQSNQAPPGGVPSSIPRPRQSLAPSSSRTSLLPQQQQQPLGASSRGGGGRQSMAPYASYEGPSSSQGSQPFSQGHGGIGTASTSTREPPMTASRANHMYNSLASFGGSMSVARNQPALSRSSFAPGQGQGGGNTTNFDYVPPSERRVSTHHRRSTLGGLPGGPTPLPSGGGGLVTPMTPGGGISSSTLVRPSKDPREVRPKRAQERHAEDILQFLSTHQCPFQLSLQNLLGPTSTHFSQVFGFLTKLFDPSINFGAPPGKGQPKVKFEDEVLMTLRTCQYPFTDSITKSHLQSIGSMQSWPNMLAMLHWLVMVIESREIAFNSDPELQMPAPDFTLRSLTSVDEVIPHAWFHFLQSAYDKFIAGEEDEMWEGDLEELRGYQDQAMSIQKGRIEDLQGENEELEREWRELSETEDPIVAFKAQQALVKRDIEKLNGYNVLISKKNAGYVQTRKQLDQTIADALEERESKQREQERLELQVKAQKLTPFEITSLNSERQQLTKALQDVQHRYRSVTEKKMSLEIDLQRELDSAQKLCVEYESKATPLGILDGPVSVPGFQEAVYFGQEVNGAAENPVPEGISTVVKPALQKLRAGTKEEINMLREAQVNLEEEMTRLREVIAEYGDVQAGLDVEFEAVDREKVDLNERIDREMHATNLELDRLQQQVHAASSTADHALQLATHRYDQRVLERRSVKQDTEAIRKANRAALEAAMDTFVSYKEHMSNGTRNLAALIAEAQEDLEIKHAAR